MMCSLLVRRRNRGGSGSRSTRGARWGLAGGWDPSRQLFWPHSSGVCFLASEGEKQNKCPHSAVVDSKIRLSIILVLWPPLYPHLPPFSPLLPHGPTFYPQNAPCSIPLQGLCLCCSLGQRYTLISPVRLFLLLTPAVLRR